MKVLVCGSRDWSDHGTIHARLNALGARYGHVTVIHGAARGADQQGGLAATGLGFNVVEFPADWRGRGRAAGIIRNLEMLDQGPDLVLAFQRDGSRGTQHTIDEARGRGIPVEVYSA